MYAARLSAIFGRGFVAASALLAATMIHGQAEASNQNLTGKKLLLKSTPKIVLISKDPSINISGSDPIGGSDSSVSFDDGSGPVTFSLPKSGWSTNGSTTLFKYKNALAPAGPSAVKIAKVKSGLLKVVAKGLPFAVPNGPATIDIVLRLDGGTNLYCMRFSGTGDGGKFLVRDAVAGTCPALRIFSAGTSDGALGDRATTSTTCDSAASAQSLACLGSSLALLSYSGDEIKDFPTKWGFSPSLRIIAGAAGVRIASDWADFTDGTWDTCLGTSCAGGSSPPGAGILSSANAAWTGSTGLGALADNCADWTSGLNTDGAYILLGQCFGQADVPSFCDANQTFDDAGSGCANVLDMLCICAELPPAPPAPTPSPTPTQPPTITPTPTSTPIPKRIFVTSFVDDGNFIGLGVPDFYCQTDADNASLGGTYVAWLSSGIAPAANRTTHATVPYVLPTGTKVADDYNDFTDGDALDAPVDRGADGTLLSGVKAWTGTLSDGSPDPSPFNRCNDWFSTSLSGRVASDQLVDAGLEPCSSFLHFWCLEQ